MTGVWRLRAAALTLVGALVVHHGRYAFASHEHEHAVAAAHRYLTWLAPVAAVLLLLAVAQLAASLGGRRAERRPALPGVRTLWPAATATLLVVFGAQECLETLLAHGTLPGTGDGAWTALPFATAAGGAIALLLRGAQEVVRWALGRARRARRPAAAVVAAPRAAVLAAPRSVLGRRLAGRGPPPAPATG
jgi:hypothetical protein